MGSCTIKNSPSTCIRAKSAMNLLLTTTVLALVGINICTGADGLPSYAASEFHVAFLRQLSSSSPIEMIVFTKSSTPVQFNISSSTGFNHTGTTTSNAVRMSTSIMECQRQLQIQSDKVRSS